jgi:hypothetical protein
MLSTEYSVHSSDEVCRRDCGGTAGSCFFRFRCGKFCRPTTVQNAPPAYTASRSRVQARIVGKYCCPDFTSDWHKLHADTSVCSGCLPPSSCKSVGWKLACMTCWLDSGRTSREQSRGISVTRRRDKPLWHQVHSTTLTVPRGPQVFRS